MRWVWVASLCASIALAAACGSKNNGFGGGAGGDGGAGGADGAPATDTLKLDPADLVVDVNGTSAPAPITYKATLAHPDGTSQDVTSVATFSVAGLGDPVGNFTANVFNVAPAKVGKTTIQATDANVTGTTTLTVRRAAVIVAPGAPADAPSKFGGAEDPSKKPTLVYPPDGVMVPPNMNTIEVHWQPKGATNLYELHVTSAVLDLQVYFTCQSTGTGCVYAPDQTVWTLLASAGRGADPLTWTIRATDGTTVGTSDPRTISFGEEDLLGGIYYWNAAAGATMRYEFGVSGQQAETFINAPQAGAGVCVGCHVLSRDGKSIALGMDIPAPAAFKVFDVATKSAVFTGAQGSNFFAFSPDDSQLLVSNGVSIGLRKASDGSAITDPLVPSGAMPDWSPDGQSIVYAKPGSAPPAAIPGVTAASIATMTLNNGQWTPGTTLVPATGGNNYYPSFSPDGAWVIFNRSPSAHDSYDAPDAEVWVVSAKGNASALPMPNARFGGDSWPKWSTAVQKYKNKTLLWFTFSSRRPYGVRPNTACQDNNGGTACAQIWMAAFDPEAAAAGKDASYPAFWLPFQDFKSGNHIAQWVTRVERKPCGQGGDQCDANETCQSGRCVPIVK